MQKKKIRMKINQPIFIFKVNELSVSIFAFFIEIFFGSIRTVSSKRIFMNLFIKISCTWMWMASKYDSTELRIQLVTRLSRICLVLFLEKASKASLISENKPEHLTSK